MSGDVSVACSIIDTDMLVVSHNHVAASGIPTVSNFTFFYFFFAEKKKQHKKQKKNLLNCARICCRLSVVVSSAWKAICEWMSEESITLPEGQQLCVFPWCGMHSARVCQGLHICMCVFLGYCGLSGSWNSLSYLRFLLLN